MSIQPLLSIAIPTWNRFESVVDLVESIGHKDDPDVEIVISDNCSPPEIVEKLSKFSLSFSNIRLSTNPTNVGMVKNWNLSIKKTQGLWICLVCSDDLFVNEGVDRILAAAKQMSYPCLVVQDPAIGAPSEFCGPGVECVRNLRLPIVSGNFWHSEITAVMGGFDERLRYSPDAEFWYRIASKYSVLKLRDPIAVYRNHEHNYAYSTWTKK